MPASREDFVPDRSPVKIEAGRLRKRGGNGCSDRISAILGKSFGGITNRPSCTSDDLHSRIQKSLSVEVLRVLNACHAKIYGIGEKDRIDQRVPTVLLQSRTYSACPASR